MHDQLAGVPKAMTNGKLDERKIKENCKKHNRSSNAEYPLATNVKPEIRGILDHNTKSADLKLQRKQKELIMAVSALAFSCDACAASESQEMKTVVKNVSDAMSLNLQVVRGIYRLNAARDFPPPPSLSLIHI